MAKASLWQRIRNTVRRVFNGGGGGNNTAVRRASSQTYYGGGRGNVKDRRAVVNNYKGRTENTYTPEEREEKRKALQQKFKAQETKYKSSADAFKSSSDFKDAPPTPRKKSSSSVKSTKDLVKSGDYEYYKASNKNTRSADERPTLTPTMQAYKKRGVSKGESLARGVIKGASWGVSDNLLKGQTDTEKAREKYYQKNKSKGWETAGEIAGSLVSFGGLGKAGAKTVGKLTATEGGKKLVAKTAKSGLVKASAKRSIDKAIKKGVTEKASKELLEEVSKRKAERLIKGLGTDAFINATGGLVSDVNRADKNNKRFSDGWWKELGESAAFNVALGGATEVVPALKASKNVVKDSLENATRQAGKNAIANVPNAKPKLPELKNDEGLADSLSNIRRFAPQNAEPKTTSIVDNVLNKAETGAVINGEPERATTQVIANEQKANPLKSAKATIKDDTAAVSDNAQMTLEDAIRASERSEAKAPAETVERKIPPKTKAKKKDAEIAEREMLESVQRQREAKMDSKIRYESGGEYGYRQGEHTATAHAPINEARRIEEDQKKIAKQLEDGNVKELFEDSNNPFGVFKTANKAERQKVAGEAATRVANDAHGVVTRLREKEQRLIADLTNKSALSSSEHVTLDDIADITAIRNMFEDAGQALPAEYEEAFSRIIEWQRTESAQMLKATDLFLKENDANYRRAFIARDMDKYLRKVLNADDKAIADIKRSLDENNGAGYYDKMLRALAEFKGEKNEAAFRKAYADFQAEVFMNTKPTVWDTINLWRHAFMLSSPKTGANNIIGNVMQRAMYRIADEMNIALEGVASKINPEITRTTARLKSSDQRRLARIYTSGKRGAINTGKNADYLKGFKDQDFADVINRVSDADVGDMMASSKYMGDVVKGLKYNPTTVGGKVQEGLTKAGALQNEYVSLMLNEPDSWFVERNYRMTLLKYLEANGVNSSESLASKKGQRLLAEARAYAKDTALENTYKKANRVVSFLEGVRQKGHTKGSNVLYKPAAIALDAEVPYLKVPTNLVINNFKYSPLGAFKGGIDASRAIMKGDVEMLNRATRELSKGLTGTGMMALGYMMFCRDQMDDDSWGFIGNAKDELKEYGVRDNSFKIGNKNFNISNIGIGSVQFLMGASLAEDLAENGQTPPYQVALDAISKTVDVVSDMSLMENAVSLLDTFGNGGDYDATVSDRLGRASAEIAGDYAAQFIPNPLRGVAKGITSADLDTGVKKGDTTKVERILERNVNNYVQGVPIRNEKLLAHKVDTHGNLVNERKTAKDKLNAVLNNTLNPLSTNTVNIPDVDKEELKVKKENGEAFKPYGFDKDRTYTAKVGTSDNAEIVDLNRKEREQVARSAKHSGYDGALSLVNAGMFGDRLGERAQGILATIPADEEEARKIIFATPEWKSATNEQKAYWLNKWYGQGQGNNNKGVARTRKEEAYVNIAGNSEGDFRFQNDLHYTQQNKYYDNGLDAVGIDKGTWADILQACKDSNHKWKEEEQKNVDTINSAKKTKLGILSIEGLTPEQRIAAYQAIRGKRDGFGWNDWNGISAGGSGYSGRRRRGSRRRRGGGGSATVKTSVPIKASDYKASKATYKSAAEGLKSRSSSKKKTKVKATPTVKVEPPKVKMKKYTV